VLITEGGRLLSAHASGAVLAWDIAQGSHEILAHHPDVCSMRAHGTALVTADNSNRREVHLWRDAHSESPPEVLTSYVRDGRRQRPFVTEFSPDGSLLVTSGSGGPVDFWRVATGEHLGMLDLAAVKTSARSARFSPDGDRLYLGTTASSVLVFEVNGDAVESG